MDDLFSDSLTHSLTHSVSDSVCHSLTDSHSQSVSNTRLPDYQTTRLKRSSPPKGENYGDLTHGFYPEKRRELRGYQRSAIDRVRAEVSAGCKRVMLQLPTGGGKTAIAGEIVRRALERGNRVAFTVPAISLIDQTVESFGETGIVDIGVVQADHPLTRPSARVQICSVDTLVRRRKPDVQLVIVDEAHRHSKAIIRWMEHCPDVIFIGLSATPWSKNLGKIYQKLVVAGTTADMIEQGYLSPFRVFAPSHPDLSGVKTVAGDYHEGQLGEAMDKPPLIADIVRTWLELGAGEPTLVFAVNRAHAKHIQREFESAGVHAGHIDAYTPSHERDMIAQAFSDGSQRVVVNVGCLTTGVDWDVRCIVLARPTRSEILFSQIIGRGLRNAPGKKELTIIDHSDTHLRLGFVTDIHHETLDMGKRSESKTERKEPLPKECPKCHFLKPAKVGTCPSCGFKPEKQSDVEVVDGELVEITGKKKKYTAGEKQDWYSQLMWIAGDKGYKRGWVSHKYREKFGVWPKGMNEFPSPPKQEVKNWITAMNIRNAKRKTKNANG